MALLNQQLTMGMSGDGRAAISKQIPLQGNSPIVISYTTRNDTTQSLSQAIRKDGLQGILFNCDVDATLTFRDGGGTAVGTVVLEAGKPNAWYPGLGPVFLSDDSASINVSTAAIGTLDIFGIQNLGSPDATCALSGTLAATHAESDVVTGGKTIILTLTGANWQPAGAAFDAQRAGILNGLTAATSQTNGWNNAVKPLLAPSDVTRTSATVATILLPAVGSYAIASDEVVTATVPTGATNVAEPIVASPAITITNGI